MAATDWADLCTQTIVWEPAAGFDAYGKPTYGTAQTFTGRRVYKSSRVPTGQGGQAVDALSGSQIWILGTPDIKLSDRVYVQGDTTYPPVLDVQRFPDEVGEHHVKVLMGRFA